MTKVQIGKLSVDARKGTFQFRATPAQLRTKPPRLLAKLG